MFNNVESIQMTTKDLPEYITESGIRKTILPMGRTKFNSLLKSGVLPPPATVIGRVRYWRSVDVRAAIEGMSHA